MRACAAEVHVEAVLPCAALLAPTRYALAVARRTCFSVAVSLCRNAVSGDSDRMYLLVLAR